MSIYLDDYQQNLLIWVFIFVLLRLQNPNKTNRKKAIRRTKDAHLYKEHVLSIVLQVSGGLPKLCVEYQWRANLEINMTDPDKTSLMTTMHHLTVAIVAVEHAQVVQQTVDDDGAVWEKEGRAYKMPIMNILK
jgi:hypothetical protein